jgi:hypothetical protein
MKIGESVSVRGRITEKIENESGIHYTVKCWKDDGNEFLNSLTVKERAVEPYVGGNCV